MPCLKRFEAFTRFLFHLNFRCIQKYCHRPDVKENNALKIHEAVQFLLTRLMHGFGVNIEEYLN